ncbi:MAG: glycogen/starch/alpha-glucan phosphorylase [Clostridiales bacterium]|jgi:starch phosphorylase|nr:glycogen/starch/alpha-glucan phosphorylase [Clostridiales bacterium]
MEAMNGYGPAQTEQVNPMWFMKDGEQAAPINMAGPVEREMPIEMATQIERKTPVESAPPIDRAKPADQADFVERRNTPDRRRARRRSSEAGHAGGGAKSGVPADVKPGIRTGGGAKSSATADASPGTHIAPFSGTRDEAARDTREKIHGGAATAARAAPAANTAHATSVNGAAAPVSRPTPNAAADAGSASELLEQEKQRLLQKLSDKLQHHHGSTLQDASKKQLYSAIALTVRDSIMEMWTASKEDTENNRRKQLYYLSLEFLVGRALDNNIINLLKSDAYQAVCDTLGISLDDIAEQENDAGLGNGGLGRLAACFLDSLSTLRMNATGCGIRYEYGLFRQKIMDGYQIELPDPWLEDGNIWEIQSQDEQFEVRFGGEITETWEDGVTKFAHERYETVIAQPYDIPVLGYSSNVVNRLRLWSARSPKHFDMDLFNRGDYVSASKEKELAEVLSKVLYPEDNHYTGKTLRLRQQYFFVSATVQWIVWDYKRVYGTNFYKMPEYVAIHINDTHPTLAIPELMRILVDEEKLHWSDAWDITSRIFSYTNHTIMSEALERWPVTFFRQNLPRIFTIVSEINETYCKSLWDVYPGDWDRIANMAVIADGEVRMANLCIVMSKKVNGVSGLHTEILKHTIFSDYYHHTPAKFLNVTNGVTHRRWLLHANHGLARLISDTIGNGWILEPAQLAGIAPYAEDAAFAESFMKVKYENKARLADYILQMTGARVDPASMFDVQVKRLHEYKRQLLNIIHILHLYAQLKEDPRAIKHPRTFIFAAKAAPGYYRARLIIKLITSISEHLANDPDPKVREMLRVVFVENYGVSIAEKIIPAADVSEQISTAGKEASGTGNMKFMLNGALTIGTLDGANVEMRERVGDDNIYIFGLTAGEVQKLYADGSYNSRQVYDADRALAHAVNLIADGTLTPEKPRLFIDIFNSLLYNEGGMSDEYLVLKDFKSYANTQLRVEADFLQKRLWNQKAIVNVANAGYFSSDRSIHDYNEKIWRLR